MSADLFPVEVLQHIALHASYPTVVMLRRTSAVFRDIIDARFWAMYYAYHHSVVPTNHAERNCLRAARLPAHSSCVVDAHLELDALRLFGCSLGAVWVANVPTCSTGRW